MINVKSLTRDELSRKTQISVRTLRSEKDVIYEFL